MIELSQRVQTIKPSATLAVSARAAQLKAEGRDIIGLGTGEPDFDTPEHIKQAAIEAMNAGMTKYTAVDGTPLLKQAIIDKFKRENDLDFAAPQIIVSSGAKQCLYNLAQALLNADDEVIIAAPYWVSYPDIVRCANGKPVIINSSIEQQYKITAQQLADAITPRTRMVILNSPSNPSGIAYHPDELQQLADVLVKHPNIVIVSDDIYEHILWTNNPFTNIAMLCPKLLDRTVIINGVSKAYSMTGWRIGYAAGPEKLIAAMKKLQSQSTSNPCSIAQAAAVAALNEDQQCVRDMCSAFKKRHDFLIPQLQGLPGVNCLPSDGTFYSFPNLNEAIAKLDGINNDVEFAEHLLNEVGLALVPGTAFGMPGSIRLSFACSEDTLNNAVSRLAKALR